MSNNNPKNGARVIDSNDRVRQVMEQLYRENKLAGGASPGEFVEGLFDNAPRIDPPEPEIDMEAVKAEAEELLAAANLKSKQIEEDAYTLAEQIKEQARAEGEQAGYAAGMEQANAVLARERAALEEERAKMQATYEQEYADMEPKLLKTLMEVVEDVFHMEFSHRPEAILASINGVISNEEGAKSFNIKTNKLNYAYLSPRKSQIEELVGSNCSIEFSIDEGLNDSQCLIETDIGIFDCSLDLQLNNLFEQLRKLC